MLAGPLCLPLPGDEVDVVPQRRVVSGHVLCGGVLAGAVRFGGVRLCQRPQADQQRQGESQHRHPQPHGALHLLGGMGWGRKPPSALAPTAGPAPPPQRAPARDAPRPPSLCPFPCLSPSPSLPRPCPQAQARPVAALTAAAAAERFSAQPDASTRGSGLPSAGLRASPGCFKASPAGRRGLGRSRLACSGPPPPPRSACPGPGRGTAAAAGRDREEPRGRAPPLPPPRPAHLPAAPRTAPAAPANPTRGLRAGSDPHPRAVRSAPRVPGSAVGARVPVTARCPKPGRGRGASVGNEFTPLLRHRRGPRLELLSRSAAQHKAKKARRFGATENTKSVLRAQTSYLLNG